MTNNQYEYNHIEDEDETSPIINTISNMVLICGGISLFITLKILADWLISAIANLKSS